MDWRRLIKAWLNEMTQQLSAILSNTLNCCFWHIIINLPSQYNMLNVTYTPTFSVCFHMAAPFRRSPALLLCILAYVLWLACCSLNMTSLRAGPLACLSAQIRSAWSAWSACRPKLPAVVAAAASEQQTHYNHVLCGADHALDARARDFNRYKHVDTKPFTVFGRFVSIRLVRSFVCWRPAGIDKNNNNMRTIYVYGIHNTMSIEYSICECGSNGLARPAIFAHSFLRWQTH